MVILSQGAEAILFLKNDKVYKKRIAKSYRLTEINNVLLLSRTNRERKVLQKAALLGIPVPHLFPQTEKFTLVIEYFAGQRFKDWLRTQGEKNLLLAKTYLQQIGTWLAILHDNNIIHGDLTTSNVLYTENKKIILIDFGLSFFSSKIEDRAVDLHLFEQALQSTHYQHADKYFSFFLEGYQKSKLANDVLQRLAVVRKRGKNKQ